MIKKYQTEKHTGHPCGSVQGLSRRRCPVQTERGIPVKRIVSFLLTFILCLTCCTCFADDLKDCDLSYANSMNLSTEEWFSTDINRAALTVLVLFEFWQKDLIDSLDSYDILESVVCRPTDEDLAVLICGEKDTLLVFYTPRMPFSQYLFMKKSNAAELQKGLSNVFGERIPNTADSILAAMEMLRPMMSGK